MRRNEGDWDIQSVGQKKKKGECISLFSIFVCIFPKKPVIPTLSNKTTYKNMLFLIFSSNLSNKTN
jgi:hypothetical protein